MVIPFHALIHAGAVVCRPRPIGGTAAYYRGWAGRPAPRLVFQKPPRCAAARHVQRWRGCLSTHRRSEILKPTRQEGTGGGTCLGSYRRNDTSSAMGSTRRAKLSAPPPLRCFPAPFPVSLRSSTLFPLSLYPSSLFSLVVLLFFPCLWPVHLPSPIALISSPPSSVPSTPSPSAHLLSS